MAQTAPKRLRDPLLGLLLVSTLACAKKDANRPAIVAAEPIPVEVDVPASPIHWPIAPGVPSFVTQSPAISSQPFPCGSGVNRRHLIKGESGHDDITDYSESFDLVVRYPHGSDADREGRHAAVVSVADGVVVAVNYQQNECDRPFGAGNYVIVEHPDLLVDGQPLRSAYMHLNSMDSAELAAKCSSNPSPTAARDFSPPTVGTTVRAGEKLGEVGNTGNSSGPHLHFQLATQCILEPADAVDCPAVSVLAISPRGFRDIQVQRESTCNGIELAGQAGYLADGSYVTSTMAIASDLLVRRSDHEAGEYHGSPAKP